MKRFVLAMCVGTAACAGASSPPVAPGSALEPAAPVATTACYQGLSSGAGQRVRTIVRRVVDPAGRQIVEDVLHDDAGRAARHFHVVMTVDGARFTMTEAGGGFTGTGTLVGEPWRWTSWTSTSKLAAAGQGPGPGPGPGIEVASRDELTATGLVAHKQVTKDGALVATIEDDLAAFDCAGWDAAQAQLAVPVLDDALCDRACRRYATLKLEAAIQAQAGQSDAARDEARRALTAKLDAGAPACVAQCRAANNAAQTACLANAATLDQLAACDAK